MAAALLAALGIGLVAGLVGRLVLPGRHGLVHLLRRDPKLAPRLFTRDVETRWEVSAGLIGALSGYLLGRFLDAANPFGPTPLRWILCIVGAIVLVIISIASEMIERSRFTRRVGMHR